VRREVSKAQLERSAAWDKLELDVYGPRAPTLPDKWLHWLRARTSAVEPTLPLDHDTGLFRRFADLDFEPVTYQRFADDYGLLMAGSIMSLWSIASFHACLRRALSLPVPQWILERLPPSIDLNAKLRALDAQGKLTIDLSHSVIGNLLLLGEGDALQPIIRLSLLIEHGCNIGIAPNAASTCLGLMIRPRNLMAAMALQTIRHLSGERERAGVKLLKCEHCNTHFDAGSGTGRRTTSKFCSRDCQNRSSYARRSKAGLGTKQGTSKPGPSPDTTK
jgi:hypothetical protein